MKACNSNLSAAAGTASIRRVAMSAHPSGTHAPARRANRFSPFFRASDPLFDRYRTVFGGFHRFHRFRIFPT
jgi:hypothetical protein